MEKLRLFLNESEMTIEQFARACGVSSRSVMNWLSGAKKPTGNFDKIASITNGAVTANDFYGLPTDSGKRG